MGEQVNPFYLLVTTRQQMSEVDVLVTNSEHSENCTGGTNGWNAWEGEVPTKDVTVSLRQSRRLFSSENDVPENTSGDVGDKESCGSHFPFDLQTEN